MSHWTRELDIAAEDVQSGDLFRAPRHHGAGTGIWSPWFHAAEVSIETDGTLPGEVSITVEGTAMRVVFPRDERLRVQREVGR